MHLDIATLLFAMTVCMVTMAVALPAVMGPVNAPARRAQAGVVLQGSGLGAAAALGPGRARLARRPDPLDAGDGRNRRRPGAEHLGVRSLVRPRRRESCCRSLIAVVMPLGYCLGFSSYPFRVGWANGLLTRADGVPRRRGLAQARGRGRHGGAGCSSSACGADGVHARARHPRRVLHRELSDLPRAASGELRLRDDRQRDHGAVADGGAARASRRGRARARAAGRRRRPDRRAQPQRLDDAAPRPSWR